MVADKTRAYLHFLNLDQCPLLYMPHVYNCVWVVSMPDGAIPPASEHSLKAWVGVHLHGIVSSIMR